MRVFIRFQELEDMKEYLRTLETIGMDETRYRQSKRKPNVLTVDYEDEAECRRLTKGIEKKAEIFGDVKFEPFENE